MPSHSGPNTKGEENLVFGYDLEDSANSFPGIPAVNCAKAPNTSGQGVGSGSWSVTEVTDGSILPPRKGARVFKFVAGSTSNLYRQSSYYYGGGFSNNNPQNTLILGRTSPSNFTTVSESNKYRWGFWVRGVSTNSTGWAISIDIGDRGGASYAIGNNTDWYFINCTNNLGINSTTHPYDFFDLYTANQGLTMYVVDMGIMRSPGTVDSLPIMQAYPQWVDYGQERSYTEGLLDHTGNSTIDLTNVSFDSDAQISFDGTDDHITGTLPIQGNGAAHTIEIVMSLDVNQNAVGSRRDPFTIGNAVTHQYSSLDINSGYMNWYFYSRDTVFTNSPLMVAGQYYHMILSYAGGASNNINKRVWFNGVEQTLSAGSSEISQLPDNPQFSIGRDRGRNTAYFPGQVPLFKVYNRALTEEEALANFNAIKGRFNI